MKHFKYPINIDNNNDDGVLKYIKYRYKTQEYNIITEGRADKAIFMRVNYYNIII